MKVNDFVQEFKNKKIINNKINDHAVSDYIQETLAIKTYIPFKTKREIVEMIAEKSIIEVDGVKLHDSINAYIIFVVAMLSSHTVLEFDMKDPISDYDLLAENGLLPQIIAEFQNSYNECDVLLKMTIAMKLEDNNMNILFGKFLNGILERLDIVGKLVQESISGVDIKEIVGEVFNQEDLNKLKCFLDKYTR